MPISINTENDIVYVFQAHDGSWRWHRVDTNNGQVVVQGGHPYNSQDYAWAAAVAYNPGLIVEHGE